MSIFDEFDANFDTAGLAKDAAEAAKNGNTRREVPHGTYEVEINKLELGKSKKGDPMFSCWFKILAGEYKGSLIFMNQIVTQGFQILCLPSAAPELRFRRREQRYRKDRHPCGWRVRGKE